MKNDSFGDRMKNHERVETAAQFDPTLPLYARIDGRGFSKFTRGMERPFDAEMSAAMITTTMALVERTNARIGYVQSDEISLLFYNEPGSSSSFIFDGKKQKMVSVLAGLATAAFTQAIVRSERLGPAGYADRLPHFDARVFSLPSKTEAANAFLWREQDATKNAISMAAYAVMSHNTLQNKCSAEKMALMAEQGVDFESYPAFFRRGTFVRRILEERVLNETEREAIPESNRPPADHTFLRSRLVTLDMPSFVTVSNREAVLFDGVDSVVIS